MSEPTLQTSTEVTDNLSLETHPETTNIERIAKSDRGVVASIKKTVEKVVDKIKG